MNEKRPLSAKEVFTRCAQMLGLSASKLHAILRPKQKPNSELALSVLRGNLQVPEAASIIDVTRDHGKQWLEDYLETTI